MVIADQSAIPANDSNFLCFAFEPMSMLKDVIPATEAGQVRLRLKDLHDFACPVRMRYGIVVNERNDIASGRFQSLVYCVHHAGTFHQLQTEGKAGQEPAHRFVRCSIVFAGYDNHLVYRPFLPLQSFQGRM